jgi:hypothetical protein
MLVKGRNESMKKLSFNIVILVILTTQTVLTQSDESGVPLNTLSNAEKLSGWQLLWDGKTTKGWRSAHSETFPEKGWQIKDGILTVLDSARTGPASGGDIITNDTYGTFELSLEFKITPGANSGIKYFVYPQNSRENRPVVGLEFQLLDDTSHPDARQGTDGNHTLASLYDLIPAENKSANPPGTWNHARIVVKMNGDIEHWLNGSRVVACNRFSQTFKTLIQFSKYKEYDNFGRIPQGHILLQDHGDMVHFRNLKIRKI